MTFIVLGLVMLFREDHLMKLPPFLFVSNLVVLNVHNHFILDSEPLEMPVGSLMAFVVWASFIAMRYVVMHRSWKAIAPDQERYEQAWDKLLGDPETMERLSELETATARLQCCNLYRPRRPLQTVLRDAGSSGLLCVPESLENVHPTNPRATSGGGDCSVACLDQLYTHAVVLNPIFQRKVQ